MPTLTHRCPWFVSAHATRRYQELGGAPGLEPAAARTELIERCAEIWARYELNPDLAPTISRTGAYIYRGGGKGRRVEVLVSMLLRAEGPKGQVVDVVSVESGRGRRSVSRRARIPKVGDQVVEDEKSVRLFVVCVDEHCVGLAYQPGGTMAVRPNWIDFGLFFSFVN